MGWFNYYGLIIVALIMIPNIVFAIKTKNADSKYSNKAVETLEQIGRYGCIVFMIFNIPYTYFNFWFEHALIVYLIIDGTLSLIYLLFWTICWNKSNLFRALSLSIIPSIIFVASGILLANMLLIAFSVLFSVFHIFISCKSTRIGRKVA